MKIKRLLTLIAPRTISRLINDSYQKIVKFISRFQDSIARVGRDSVGFLRDNVKIIIQIIIAVGVLLSMIFTGYQAYLLQSQIELEARPFISIEKVYWWYKPNTDSFESGFVRKNYGSRPAVNFHFRNFRAIIFKIDTARIEQKVKSRISEEQLRYVKEYVLDERYRLTLNLMEILAKYFKTHPDAINAEVNMFLKGLTTESSEISDKEILFQQDQLLFRVVEINNDMDEYSKRQRIIVFPNGEQLGGLRQQMGKGGLQGVVNGENLLVVYWAFQYMDIQKDKGYSNFYIGYSDKNFSQSVRLKKNGRHRSLVKEFQSWSSEQ